jgi:hypothetical protein
MTLGVGFRQQQEENHVSNLGCSKVRSTARIEQGGMDSRCDADAAAAPEAQEHEEMPHQQELSKFRSIMLGELYHLTQHIKQ